MNKMRKIKNIVPIIYLVAIIWLSIRLLIVTENNKLVMTFVIMNFTFYILNFVLTWIMPKREVNKALKLYKESFLNLKKLYKARYKLYFSEDKERIDEYSDAIQKNGRILIEVGNDLLKTEENNKKIDEEIRIMQTEIKKMMAE